MQLRPGVALPLLLNKPWSAAQGVANANSSGSGSCFDEATNPPRCNFDGPGRSVIPVHDSASSLDVQHVCETLDTEYLSNVRYNVSLHANALLELAADSALCADAQQAYGQCVWCTPPNTNNATTNSERSRSYCRFSSCEAPSTLDETVDLAATCDELYNLLSQDRYPLTMDLCYRAEQAKHSCPSVCLYASDEYLGADTLRKKRVLIWLSRTVAILSFCGASYVLWDALYHPQNRCTIYHQLLVGIASCDIFTSAAWCFATAPIPADSIDGGWYVEGSSGTDKTCTAQAFFIQLGFTSIFYNVSLAAYYLLVIVHNWRELALKKVRIYLHGVPILLGLGLALAGIPVYGWMEYSCHVWGDWSWTDHLFALIPVGFSIVFITAMMMCVYWSVRKKSRASRRWSLRFGNSSDMEKQVFWQAVFYTLSFYITWPVVAVVYLKDVNFEEGDYWFSVLVALVGPLQGFNNFLVYVRPRAKNLHMITYASSLLRHSISMSMRRMGSTVPVSPRPPPLDFLAELDPSAFIAVDRDNDNRHETTESTEPSEAGRDSHAVSLKKSVSFAIKEGNAAVDDISDSSSKGNVVCFALDAEVPSDSESATNNTAMRGEMGIAEDSLDAEVPSDTESTTNDERGIRGEMGIAMDKAEDALDA